MLSGRLSISKRRINTFMERLKKWWSEDKRYLTLIKAGMMALLPVLCCLITCAVQGKTIGEVYLPSSEWNDELFYFKQVEGIVNYGFPQGYFGFNESHALKLSFAAWSPVLVWPWILWGLIFGWNLMSPIICNIVLLTLAMFLFVWLVKPTWKQLGILTFLFSLYTLFPRYLLSGMPEIICFSMLIVFYGLAVNYLEKERTYKLVLLFVMSGLLVLMRPYMLLFLLLPICLWVRRGKWKGLIGSGAVLVGVLGCYALIKHELGAEYFAPLFFTEWITTFFEKGLLAGIHNFFGTLYYMGRNFLGHTVEGFRSGLASGAFFGGYLLMMAILLWQSFADGRKLRREIRQELLNAQQETDAQQDIAAKQKMGAQPEQKHAPGLRTRLVVEAHLAFAFVGMLFALLLMYKLTEGSKHLLTFMAVGIFIVSLMDTVYFKKVVLLGAAFAFLYSYRAVEPYDYQIPFAEQERTAQIAYWEEIFDSNLKLVEEDVPNYENVVIWTFGDTVSGKSINEKWQLLYCLPEGFGISCCMPDYVTEHLDELQSRYLTTVAGGTIDRLCEESGYREIARDADMVLYERY